MLFRVVGALQQDAGLGVGQSEAAVDLAACLGEGFILGVQGGGSEGDAGVQVVHVDDEVREAAAVGHCAGSLASWSMWS